MALVGSSPSRIEANGSRSSWLPITQMTRDPIRSAAGSTSRFESFVGVGFAEIGEIAGDDDRLGMHAGALELREGARDGGIGVDGAVERPGPAEEVGVADVRDDVNRGCVLPELDHGASVARSPVVRVGRAP